jgi:hypothetical protein
MWSKDETTSSMVGTLWSFLRIDISSSLYLFEKVRKK